MSRPKKRPVKDGNKSAIFNDFGTYLKSLRVEKNITIAKLADGLGLSPATVKNIEEGTNPAPGEDRLQLWLRVLGQSSRYHQARRLLRNVKTFRRINYQPRHPANEHIDRLIDAYDLGRLSKADLNLLRMVAPRKYNE